MRVIAGSAKRMPLKSLGGMETRPTTDRIKETLFNMIDPWIAGCRFLDLFAGSGSIGIEALSRGAKEAVFIEKNPKAMEIIQENLEFTRLKERAVTIQTDVLAGLQRLEEKFDYIFIDPPYHKLLEAAVLREIMARELLEHDGLVIVEAALETDFSYIEELGYHLVKEKRYKTNKHVFLEIAEELVA